MTREEAKRVLEIMKMSISGLCDTEKEALDFAIKELGGEEDERQDL